MQDEEAEDDGTGLWRAAMRDVKPLKGRAPPAKDKKSKHKKSSAQVSVDFAVPLPSRGEKLKTGTEVDKNTALRFQRGEMPVEARLDLHGYVLAEAETALKLFVRQCWHRRARCILVITGKGGRLQAADEDWFMQGSSGTIRGMAPGWLQSPDMRGMILQTAQARPKDGGKGAFYILLRRQRTT